MLTKPFRRGDRRQYVDEDYVVVDSERRDWSTVGPDKSSLAPTFAVAFEGEVGVVGYDVAVDELDTFCTSASASASSA